MKFGKETTITAGGKSFRLARFETRHEPVIVAWAAAKLPDPLTAIKDRLHEFPPAVQRLIVSEAVSQVGRKRSMADPAIQDVLATVEGVEHVATVLLRECHPELSEDDALSFIRLFVQEHGWQALELAIVQTEGRQPLTRQEAQEQVLTEAGLLEKKTGQ